ncbi:MAG: hypothetical protein HQ488_01765 [Parcubacteria group bacterium]|nr:hypothetical protein [Parcubacteria group bacterium]
MLLKRSTQFVTLTLVILSLMAVFGVVLSAAPPNVVTYQGRVLDTNGVPSSSSSLTMKFFFYDASSSGTCLWSNSSADCDSNTPASTTGRSVTLTTGLFTQNLGDTSDSFAAVADSVFGDNTSVYLEVDIAGETLSPRKRLTAAPYAINAQRLDGIDSTGFLASTGDTGTGIFDFTAATLAGASPFVFEGTTANDFETTFTFTDPTGDNVYTFKDGSGTIAFTSDISGTGLWEDGVSGVFEDDEAVIIGSNAAFTYGSGGVGDLQVFDELEVMGDTFIDNDLVVGASTSSTETLSHTSFTLDGDDLFVAGTLGVEGVVYSDGGFTASTTTTFGAGAITTTGSTDLALTIAGGDLTFAQNTTIGDGGDTIAISTSDWNITATGNLSGIGTIATDGDATLGADLIISSGVRIGTGSTPASFTALANDSLFVEGAIEVDGAARFDSTMDINGIPSIGADITFNAATPTIVITNGETFAITDGTNTLFSLVDGGTGGNLILTGDLTIAGDDLTMDTNTAGFLLVGDGTNYNPVDISGDIDLDSSGVATVQANSVALSTDTTGNYVATVSDAGNGTITVGGAAGEGTVITLDAVNVNCNDCLDFAELSDALTLDASTSITMDSTDQLLITNGGTGDVIFNLSSTGDFVIQDNGTPSFTASDNGAFTFDGAVTFNSATTHTLATSESIAISNNTATADTFDISVTAAGNDAQEINFTLGNDGDNDTVNALEINVTSATTGEEDVIRGLHIAPLSSADASVTEQALVIGSGWDTNLFFNDTSTVIELADTGVITWREAGGTNTLMTLTDNANVGDLLISGDFTIQGDNLDSAGAPLVLNATAADEVRVGTGTPGVATGAGDFYVTSDIEADGNLNIAGSATIGSLVCNDCFDFTEFADALALDASTSITMDSTDQLLVTNGGAGDVIFNLSSSGDFVIQDGATPIFTAGGDGTFTFDGATTFNTDVTYTLVATENVAITNTSAETEVLDLTVTAAENDGAEINFTLGNDADADIVNALEIRATSASTGDADVLRGINIAQLSSSDPTVSEIALRIANGWDSNLTFADTSTFIDILDTGVFTFRELGGNNTLMTLTDNANVGDLALTGDLTVNGDDISSDSNLSIAATGYVRIGDSGTPGSASDDDSLYVEGKLEVDATSTFDGVVLGNNDTTFTLSGTNNFLIENGSATSDLFSVKISSAQSNGETIQFGLADDGDADTLSALNIAVTSAATGDADVLSALNIANLASADGTVIETAIIIGTGWDTGISLGANSIVGTTGLIDYTNFDVLATGAIQVTPNVGLDTNAGGVLSLATTNATSITTGNALTTFSLAGTGLTTLNIATANSTAATLNLATSNQANVINIGTGTGIDDINIGGGGTGVDTINIGDSTATVAIQGGSITFTPGDDDGSGSGSEGGLVKMELSHTGSLAYAQDPQFLIEADGPSNNNFTGVFKIVHAPPSDRSGAFDFATQYIQFDGVATTDNTTHQAIVIDGNLADDGSDDNFYAYAARINQGDTSDVAVTGYGAVGVMIINENNTTTDAGDNLAGFYYDNQDTDAVTVDAFKAVSSGSAITDGLDVSDSDIVNGVNVGENFVLYNVYRTYDLSGSGLVWEDTDGNDLMILSDAANEGDLLATGDITADDFICTDCLDFAELADALTVDASTSVTMNSTDQLLFTNGGTGDIIFNLSSTGDFVIQDGGNTRFSVNDSGVTTIGTGSAPTADMLAVTNAGFATTTTDVNAASFIHTASNVSSSAVYIDGAFASTTTGLTYNILELGAITPTNTTGTDNVNGLFIGIMTDATVTIKSAAIDISTGWDVDFSLQNSEFVSNSTDGKVRFGGSGGASDTDLVFNLDDATGPVLQSTSDEIEIDATLTVDLMNVGATQFALCHPNSDLIDEAIGDCSGAPTADYAEQYPVAAGVGFGDIVVPSTTVVVTNDGDEIVQMVKSSEPYSGPVVGIVSDNFGDFTSAGYNIDESDNPMPVALVGRVPVKVTAEGGDISVGDYLTTSSTPGAAMRATKVGRVIGMALSDWDGVSATVMVQVNNSWSMGDVIGTDGVSTLVTDNVVISQLNEATAQDTSFSSYGLALRGSAWDGDEAQAVEMMLQNVVEDEDNYRLSVRNTADSEVAYITNEGIMRIAGDMVIGGNLYPSDRGVPQTDKYIYYDGSAGPGGDFMRTNASGWSTGSYDFAEMFPSTQKLTAGELVAFSGSGHNVQRATGAEGEQLAGIISTRPGFLAGENIEGAYPVALAGRVPTRVSTEGGAIAVGDPLTISSSQGIAMKAKEAGMIVGYALEAYRGGSDNLILTYVNLSYWVGETTSVMPGTDNRASGFATSGTSNFTSLNMSGNIYMGTNSITGIGRLEGLTDAWSIEQDGTITTTGLIVSLAENYQGDQVETMAVTSPEVMITLTGTAILEDGQAEVRFEQVAPEFNDIISAEAPIRVLVTPSGPVSLYVSEKDQNHFVVTRFAGEGDVEFDWMVTAYRRGYEPEEIEEVIEEEMVDEVIIEPVVETVLVEDELSTEPVEVVVEEVVEEIEVIQPVETDLTTLFIELTEEVVEDPVDPATPESPDEILIDETSEVDGGESVETPPNL